MIDESRFRTLLGQWPTGVSVITSAGPRGLTANAIASLSLEPMLLLVCVDLASNTLPAITESGRFAVNVLSTEQEHVSRRFALKEQDEKWGDVPYTLVRDVPVLGDSLAWVVCEVDRILEGGDHAIVVGRPVEGDFAEGLEPLVFFRGGYRRLS